MEIYLASTSSPWRAETWTAAGIGRRAWKLKLELAFAFLLATTLAAIFLEDRLLDRTTTLHPSGRVAHGWHAHSDSMIGGASRVRADPRTPLSWACELRPGYAYPFCGAELLFDPHVRGDGLDLSRTEKVLIAYSYRGPAETVRINLKNFDPRYTKEGLASTAKFNTAEIKARGSRSVVELSLADFTVADWWLNENKIPPHLVRTQFDNVASLEVQTGTEAPLGKYHFTIHSISLRGRLLTQAEWYLLLLGTWVAAIGAFLSQRVYAATKALRLEKQARQTAEEAAATLARNDALTGFLNRNSFREALAAALAAEGAPAAGALTLVDVRNVNEVNSAAGEDEGDAFLSELSRRISMKCGEEAVLGRIGGSEFAFFSAGTHEEQDALAVRVVQALADPVAVAGSRSLDPIVSLGTARFPEHGSDVSALLRAADIALHEARRSAEANRCLYHAGLEGSASERLAALKEQERVIRDRAQRPGFITRARTDILLRELCRNAARWPADTIVSLQLSSAEWEEDWSAERILTQLDKARLAPQRLALEISETAYLARSGATLQNLRTLQQAGVRIALAQPSGMSHSAVGKFGFDQVHFSAEQLTASLDSAEKKLLDPRASCQLLSNSRAA